jgi:hypothetical protein
MASTPGAYDDVLFLLKTAKATDTIHFYISGPGGAVSNEILLVKALLSTQAKTVMHSGRAISSAWVMIFFAGKELRIDPATIFMVHDTQCGTIDNFAPCPGVSKWDEFTHGFLSEILTPGEIKALREDKDVWITGAEVIKRLRERK